MKPLHLLMAVALAIAAWLAFFGDKTPTTGITEPLVRPSPAAGTASPPPAAQMDMRAISETAKTVHILAPLPRDQLIGGAHMDTTSGSGLFASQSWMPPPPPPPPPKPAPPPTAPPLPFTYLGKKSETGNWEVYLARGEQTFVVREQTVIEGTYRVESIKPPVLSLIYLPLQQVQMLIIGEAD